MCAPFLSVSTTNTTYPTYPLILCQAKSANEDNFIYSLDSLRSIVQHCTVQTIRQLRSSLGLSQAAFAHLIGCSKRSIVSWEQGALPNPVYCIRMRTLARKHGLTSVPGRSTLHYRPDLAAKYLGSPGSAWKHMRYHERAQWWNQRRRYQRIQAEQQAGRRP